MKLSEQQLAIRIETVLIYVLAGATLAIACRVAYVHRLVPSAQHAMVTPLAKAAFGDIGQSLSGASPMTSKGNMSGGDAMPGFASYSYTYAYVGDSFPTLSSTVTVLRRKTGGGFAPESSFLDSASLGLLKGASLKGGLVQSLSLNTGDGLYSVAIDAASGTVNFSSTAQSDDTYTSDQSSGDTLSADQLLAVASAFMAKYGISTDGYAAPIVPPALANAVADPSIPLPMGGMPSGRSEVIYPLVINGQHLYSSDGTEDGIDLFIDPLAKSVTYASNIVSLEFESSSYAAETDQATLLKTPVGMGMGGTSGKTSIIKLGTPTTGLTLQTAYQFNKREELYVPSLIFPVIDPPDGVSSIVVIPLAKQTDPNPGVSTNGLGISFGAGIGVEA